MVLKLWQRYLVVLLSFCVLVLSFGLPPAIAQDGDLSAPTLPLAKPALHQFHLIAGWNMISLPFATDPSPLVVFADLPKPWFLAEYDPVAQCYHPYTQISLRPGVGYWLHVPQAVGLTIQGTSVAIRHTCALSLGWNLVGYPFLGEISWDDAAKVKVERAGQTYSIQQAFDAGILSPDIFSWREDRYFSVKGELGKFQPGYGYWVRLNTPLPAGVGTTEQSVNLVFEPTGIATAIASKLLKAACEGIKEGVTDWTKDKACGWVMSLLTGNKGQSAEILARLDQLKAQLQDIQASLARIEADFTQLFAQLKQMQAKIIDTILNAQVKDYINRIGTHYNLPTPEGLAYFTYGKTPTTPNIQAEVAQFCTNVTGAWDIPVCVDGIHNAIAPSDGSDGLLDSWLAANILTNTATWTFQPQRLMDYYLAYESYFAGLLFYEYRGIQIYTETLNHRDPTGQTAQNYVTQYYTPNLNAEVDRFLIGCARLVAYSANLTTTNPKDPLLLGGQDVLSRAQFFAIQTRDEETYGIRTAILTTPDALNPTGNPTPLVNLANPSKGLTINWTATVLAVPEGPAYDRWDSTQGQFLGGSTDWLLLLTDFGPAVPQYQGPGWTTQLADSVLPAPISPAFPVNTYNDDYQLSATGTILYGFGLTWARLGGAQAFSLVYPWNTPNPHWRVEKNTMTMTESGKGGEMHFFKSDGLTPPLGTLGTKFWGFAAFKPDVYSVQIKGLLQDSRPFAYQGQFPASVTCRVNLQTDLYIGKAGPGLILINLQAHLGIWDLTTGKDADGSTPTAWIGAPERMKDWDKQYGTNGFVTLEQKAVLQPGHQYQLYLRVESNSSAEAMKIDYGMTLNEMRAYITYQGATLLPN